jgi:hypothetical protein
MTDLALRDAGHAERLDEVIDGARRDALNVGLPDDGGERSRACRRAPPSAAARESPG